jgi:pSer/pThr/pTyr-binding forkhead associated (FHA) protein
MPRLVLRKGEAASQDHALGPECVVGRHPSANFVLHDTLASRRHFRVFSADGAWIVEDLGSTNGIRVNGVQKQRHILSDGDVITAGGTELVFVQKDMLGAMHGTKRPAATAEPWTPPPVSLPDSNTPTQTEVSTGKPSRGDPPVRRRRRRP